MEDFINAIAVFFDQLWRLLLIEVGRLAMTDLLPRVPSIRDAEVKRRLRQWAAVLKQDWTWRRSQWQEAIKQIFEERVPRYLAGQPGSQTVDAEAIRQVNKQLSRP